MITEEEYLVLKYKYEENKNKNIKTKRETIYKDVYQFSNSFILTDDGHGMTFSLSNKKRFFDKIEKFKAE